MSELAWYQLKNTEEIITPALLLYPDRIEKNIQLMIDMVGDVARLRPHVKTHKTKEIIEMQIKHGIQKFKCATIAEAELLAQCQAKDILIAIQPVGANVTRLFSLIEKYPGSTFSTIVDHPESIARLGDLALIKNIELGLFLDLNTGMNRTGIVPNDEALILCEQIVAHSKLIFRGLHAYDGHIRNSDFLKRKEVCDASFALVTDFKSALEKKGVLVSAVVMGGSPTFPIHAVRNEVETSPGTTLLWDERYSSSFQEMKFLHAAVLLTRIISKPTDSTICLDLGHKSIAPEMEFPRVKIFNLETCEQTGQSEEHLVLNCPQEITTNIGDAYYAIPMHVCPTVAKYPETLIVLEGIIVDKWKVAARDYSLVI